MLPNKILILGKIPPPVGGVSVHVSRLVKTLVSRGFSNFHFFDFGREPISIFLVKIRQHKVIHLHTSNPYFQLIMAGYCRLTRKKLIITYHGSWGRFGFLKNRITELSAWLAFKPIVLNFESLEKAKKRNKNTVMISAFIPPFDINPLNEGLRQTLIGFRSKYQYLFCTNSWRLTFDKDGKEIYGISGLIANISRMSQSALVISDPSGTNKNFFEKQLQKIPENILFITAEHDFWNILAFSDAFIRNTTTDGDSISIHEALLLAVPVFASANASRPAGCKLFHEVAKIDFEKELENMKLSSVQRSSLEGTADTVGKIMQLYRNVYPDN